MIFFIEFIVIISIMLIATYTGYKYATKKLNTTLIFVFASIAVALISIKNIAIWIPLYLYLPRLFGLYMDILQAFGAVLIGLAYPLMKEKARQRILFVVFVIVFIFYMSFDKIYLITHDIKYAQFESREKEGVVMQSKYFTCLPASVSTILKHWGIDAKEGELAYLARTTARGTDSYHMIYAIEQLGKKQKLSAYLQNITFEELKNLPQPCILTVYFSTSKRNIPHAVVFFGKNGNKLILGDPLYGRREIDKKELFEKYSWKGETLQIWQN